MFDEAQNLSFETDRLPWQRSLRWTRTRIDRRLAAGGVLLGIALTAIELIGFGLGMQQQIAKEIRPWTTQTVQVFLVPDFDVPVPPEVEPPAKSEAHRTTQEARSITRRSEPPRIPELIAAPPPQAPALRLYAPDGRVQLPDEAAPHRAGEIGFSAHLGPARDPFARRNPVPYEPTKFESVWAPAGETLGGELIRKTTFTRTWRTPWGTEVSCSVTLIMAVLGGCGWGYAPTATIEELKAMRADPPMPKAPAPSTTGVAADKPPPPPPVLDLSLPIDVGSDPDGP